MKSLKYIKSIIIIFMCSFVLTTSSSYFDVASAQTTVAPATVQCQTSGITAPLDIVANPKIYLNKKIVMNAKFDKFSTLGLDYKPAFKSSEEYISFLIKRDDIKYDIPLSEMKLFLKRKDAEKYIDLKSNDKIQITGIVFSDALGDSWIDVQKLVILQKAPEESGVK